MMKRIFIFLIGAGLSACSSYIYKSYNAERVSVGTATVTDGEIDSLIAPYRETLAVEMNRVVGKNMQDLSPERPNSRLGQWTSDVFLQYGKDSILGGKTDLPIIALFNNGGLRASLTEGDITVGEVFQVMPFDNQLVALKLPVSQLSEIEQYLRQSGGEPIAGFRIVNGKLQLDKPATDYFWVITSDFLANGGDRMLFFQEAEEKILTNALLRDVLMREIARRREIIVTLEERITF